MRVREAGDERRAGVGAAPAAAARGRDGTLREQGRGRRGTVGVGAGTAGVELGTAEPAAAGRSAGKWAAGAARPAVGDRRGTRGEAVDGPGLQGEGAGRAGPGRVGAPAAGTAEE